MFKKYSAKLILKKNIIYIINLELIKKEYSTTKKEYKYSMYILKIN